jgi:hypothetical protein
MTRTIRPIIVGLALFAGLTPHGLAGHVEDTVAGVVARARAIVSGRLTFVYKSTSFNGERVLTTDVLPEHIASFSDSSWADRDADRSARQISYVDHNGYLLEYTVSPQPSGNINYSVNMRPPRGISAGREAQVNLPPIFAGSFWKPAQLEYVKDHAEKCRFVGKETVNGIATEKYELSVPAEDRGKAFVYFFPALKSGGVMRFFAAPQLGYVLPRIELVTLNGEVAQSDDARDFIEDSPGIFFPRHIELKNHAAGGAVFRPHEECDIRPELINQPVTEEDYIVQLPVGTNVTDARDPQHIVAFRITEPAPSSALIELSAAGGKPPGFFSRWRNAIILGVLLGMLAAIALFFVARRRWREAASY